MDEIEARIDRDYDARRNPHQRPFTREELLEASSGADALFIMPFDRLDSEFFKRVVDEDLIAALKSGRIAAAGLDVFEGEPKFHLGYLPLKNAFLLPHMGSATVETRLAMGMVVLDK
jgi:hypothetical protein